MPLGTHKATLFGVAGVSTGDVVLLASTTASDAAGIAFTSGIDSTYGEYIFGFYNIRAAADDRTFNFQVSTDGGSNYNTTVTSAHFHAHHYEDDSGTPAVNQDTGHHLQQATSYQLLTASQGNDADQSCAGALHLFSPASTTYVKQWYSEINFTAVTDYTDHCFNAGYFNTTSAVNAINFQFSADNIAAGTIKMWGVK